MGSYLKHVTQDDPERKARLMKELDGFLERDRDRGLFDLPPPQGDFRWQFRLNPLPVLSSAP